MKQAVWVALARLPLVFLILVGGGLVLCGVVLLYAISVGSMATNEALPAVVCIIFGTALMISARVLRKKFMLGD